MARGRRSGPSRLDLRREAEAAEAREKEEEKRLSEEDDEDEDEDYEADDEESSGDEDDDEESSAKKSKKKSESKPKKDSAKKPRAVKEVRMKAIWVVFDNGGKRVKEFPYSSKAAAESLLAEKMGEEKKGTYYLQLVKEPMDN